MMHWLRRRRKRLPARWGIRFSDSFLQVCTATLSDTILFAAGRVRRYYSNWRSTQKTRPPDETTTLTIAHLMQRNRSTSFRFAVTPMDRRGFASSSKSQKKSNTLRDLSDMDKHGFF